MILPTKLVIGCLLMRQRLSLRLDLLQLHSLILHKYILQYYLLDKLYSQDYGRLISSNIIRLYDISLLGCCCRP